MDFGDIDFLAVNDEDELLVHPVGNLCRTLVGALPFGETAKVESIVGVVAQIERIVGDFEIDLIDECLLGVDVVADDDNTGLVDVSLVGEEYRCIVDVGDSLAAAVALDGVANQIDFSRT